MNLRKYTLQQLEDAVKTSYSYRQVLMKLSVAPAGGNYEILKKAITFLVWMIHISVDRAGIKVKNYQ